VKIAFIDIETTGIDPTYADLVEVGIITEAGGEFEAFNSDVTKTLGEASVDALRINRYYERERDGDHLAAYQLAWEIATRTSGHVLAGANVHFDMHFLEAWMRRVGLAPAWDYHVLDVPTYAAAYINSRDGRTQKKFKPIYPPFRMNNEMFERLELKRDETLKHTALGDAKTAQMVWNYVWHISNLWVGKHDAV
jgi:DNA polymerase III alpha subunit (gram-positive type)